MPYAAAPTGAVRLRSSPQIAGSRGNNRRMTKPERSSQSKSWATSVATRRSMQSNRGRDTRPEIAVRKLLHAAGLRYRVNFLVLPRRTADIVFTRIKIVIFIDGCFWHGCPEHYEEPVSNRDYWKSKLESNRVRDEDTTCRLVHDGWTVLRFWEHVPPPHVAESIISCLQKDVI